MIRVSYSDFQLSSCMWLLYVLRLKSGLFLMNVTCVQRNLGFAHGIVTIRIMNRILNHVTGTADKNVVFSIKFSFSNTTNAWDALIESRTPSPLQYNTPDGRLCHLADVHPLLPPTSWWPPAERSPDIIWRCSSCCSSLCMLTKSPVPLSIRIEEVKLKSR